MALGSIVSSDIDSRNWSICLIACVCETCVTDSPVHRNAPMPRIGRATSAIRMRKPKIATSHGVDVVPSVAPMLIPSAWGNVIRPALTKPMTVTMVALED